MFLHTVAQIIEAASSRELTKTEEKQTIIHFRKEPCHLIMKLGAPELTSASSLTPAFCPKEGQAKTEEVASELTRAFKKPIS